MVKTCTRCEVEKPLEDFTKGEKFWCKSCVKGYSQYRENQKLRILNHLKESLPCADCNQFFPHYVTQWDHLEARDYSKNPSGFGWTRCSWAQVFLELDKCELLCANCHVTRTYWRKRARKLGIAA